MLQELQQQLTQSKLTSSFLAEHCQDEEDRIYIQLDYSDGEFNLHWTKDLGVLGDKQAIDNNYTSDKNLENLHIQARNWVGLDITEIIWEREPSEQDILA